MIGIRKAIPILLVFFLLILSGSAHAEGEYVLTINGHKTDTVHPLELSDGTAMISLDELIQISGDDCAVSWNQTDKSISIRRGDKFTYFSVGNSFAVINDRLTRLNAAPYLQEGSILYVPVHAAARFLGYVYVQSESYAQLMRTS